MMQETNWFWLGVEWARRLAVPAVIIAAFIILLLAELSMWGLMIDFQ